LEIVSNCVNLVKASEEFTEKLLQDVDAMVRTRMEGEGSTVRVPTVEEFLSRGMAEEFPREQYPHGAMVRRSSFTQDDSFLDTEVFLSFVLSISAIKASSNVDFCRSMLDSASGHWSRVSA